MGETPEERPRRAAAGKLGWPAPARLAPGAEAREVRLAQESSARSGTMLALGLMAGAAATLALLAARMRVYHHGKCPECGTALVISYEPSDDEPRIRREDDVEHPPAV